MDVSHTENQTDIFKEATAMAEAAAESGDRRKNPPEETKELDGYEFDWQNELPIIDEQKAITLYENTAGNIVIRRQADWDEDEDLVIVVTVANAKILAKELTGLAEDIEREFNRLGA